MKISKYILALSLVTGLAFLLVGSILGLSPQGHQAYVSAATTNQIQPVITSHLMHGRTSMYGIASPGAKVDIYKDGALVRTVTANSGGLWTNTGLEINENDVVQVKATLNGTSMESPKYTVRLIAQPLITSEVVVGATSIFGTADPGIKVEVWVGGVLAKTVFTNASGYWVAPIPALTSGSGKVVQARAKLFDTGSWYEDSPRYNVVSRQKNQLQPLITSELTSGGNSVSGIATPGAYVELYIDGAYIATPRADSQGAWTTKVPILRHQSRIEAIANYSGQRWQSPTCIVKTGLSKPTVTAATANQTTISGTATPGATVALYSWYSGLKTTVIANTNGIWTATLPPVAPKEALYVRSTIPGIFDRYIQSDDFGVRTVPTVTSTLTAGSNIMQGSATALSKVDIWQSDIKIGTTTTNLWGDWWIRDLPGLLRGQQIQVKTTAPEDGSVLESQKYTVQLAFVDPVASSMIVVGTVSISGKATPTSSMEIKIKDKSYFTTVNEAGEWSVTVPPLVKGDTVQMISRFGTHIYQSAIYAVPDRPGTYALVSPDVNAYRLGNAYITGSFIDTRATKVNLYNANGVLLRTESINANGTYRIYASDKLLSAGETFKIGISDGKVESALVTSTVLPRQP